MKTLYERLEPSVLEGLKHNEERYPETISIIVNELKSHNFWQDLTIGEARAVILFSDFPMIKVTRTTLLWGENIIKDEE